jgi:hypothetical protein
MLCWGPGYSQPVSQGLIYPCEQTGAGPPAGPPGMVPLYRYFSNSSNYHYTTTEKLGGDPTHCSWRRDAPASGVVVEGYLPKVR